MLPVECYSCTSIQGNNVVASNVGLMPNHCPNPCVNSQVIKLTEKLNSEMNSLMY